MDKLFVFFVILILSVVVSLPVKKSEQEGAPLESQAHIKAKRLINPLFSSGAIGSDLVKIRTKRSEECEKLQLCKLHARASHSFLASFQLYFVNKENARLWDHRGHSRADCQQRYRGCYYR